MLCYCLLVCFYGDCVLVCCSLCLYSAVVFWVAVVIVCLFIVVCFDFLVWMLTFWFCLLGLFAYLGLRSCYLCTCYVTLLPLTMVLFD